MSETPHRVCSVSVIVPVYNTEKFLSACVDSVLNQTCRDLELILVDDGSIDRSPQLCDEYAEQDFRVKVLHVENGGAAFARNRGLELAAGEYVYFLDSDDFITTDAIEKLLAKAQADDLDVVAFDGGVVNEEGQTIETGLGLVCRGSYNGVSTGRHLFAELKRNNDYSVHVQCHLIRRSCLGKLNLMFSEGGPHEDLIFTFLLYMQCERCAHLSETLFYRRFREGSITTTPLTDKKVETRLVRLEEIADYYRKNDFESEVDAMVRKDMRDIFWSIYDRYQILYVTKRRSGVKENKALKKRLYGLAESLDWLDDRKIARRCRFDSFCRLAGKATDVKRRLIRRLKKLR